MKGLTLAGGESFLFSALVESGKMVRKNAQCHEEDV